jgi:hypothetical protein
METGKAIALAGITATALVGITGATTSWLIARDDRASQQALAHEARVYDRRADTYLAALAKIEQQHNQIHKAYIRFALAQMEGKVWRSSIWRMAMAGGTDGNLYARLTAFGSPRIVAAYDRLHSIVDVLLDGEIKASRKGDYRRLGSVLDDSVRIFQQRKEEFQRLVQRELS